MTDAETSRPYRSPLRAAQAEATRQLILDSLAGLLAEDGIGEFSMRGLALRAGTSERTVYRHFPDRDSLFEAFVDRIGAERGWDPTEIGRYGLTGLDDLPDAIESSFQTFDADEESVRALVAVASTMDHELGNVRERTVRVRSLVAEAYPDLGAGERDRLLGVMRVLMSSRTWLRLKDEFGLDSKTSGALMAWVARLVLDDVTGSGRVPPD